MSKLKFCTCKFTGLGRTEVFSISAICCYTLLHQYKTSLNFVIFQTYNDEVEFKIKYIIFLRVVIILIGNNFTTNKTKTKIISLNYLIRLSKKGG